MLGYYIEFNLLLRPPADSEQIHLVLTANPMVSRAQTLISIGDHVSSLMADSQATSEKYVDIKQEEKRKKKAHGTRSNGSRDTFELHNQGGEHLLMIR